MVRPSYFVIDVNEVIYCFNQLLVDFEGMRQT